MKLHQTISSLWTSIVILSYWTGFTSGTTYKRWIHNTNLDNPENWPDGHLPCKNDRIQFPESSPPVFIQTNMSAAEIVLPVNGELVLGNDMSISFPVAKTESSTCPGRDVTFSRKSLPWFSPENWCVADSPEGVCVDPQPSLLSSERIPCAYDTVVFPKRSSFLVNLGSDAKIKVSAISVAEKFYSDKSFKDFLNSKEGKKQFVFDSEGRPTRIHVSQEKCDDISGCACANDQDQIMEALCEAAPACPIPVCNAGIKPAGSCCPVCGAIMEVDYGSGFKIKRISSIIKRRYVDNNVEASGKVNYSVSKMSDETIQIVFSDAKDGSVATQVANAFKNAMEQDIRSSARKYGIVSITMKTSGNKQPNTFKQRGGAVSSGSVAAIIFSIILVIAIIGLAIFCFADRRKCTRLPSSIPFRKTKDENGDLELGPSIAFTDLAARGSFGEVCGFNNPMYDTQMKNGNKPPLPLDDTVAVTETDGKELDPATLPISTITVNGHSESNVRGFDNPLYSPVETVFPSSFEADPSLKFNPVYSTEGLEEDSAI